MLAVQVVICIPILVGLAVGDKWGSVGRAAAWAISTVIGFVAVYSFYKLCDRWDIGRRRHLEETYRFIYRVLAVSAEAPSVKGDGVEITPGDYGWEAEPIFNDGLIYLHGLTEEWRVVWYAGFEPNQVERICPKPRSQYFLPYSWICAGGKPPPCPYPVLNSPRNSLGHPEQIYFPFVQGIRVSSPASRDERSEKSEL
jgi:hypothetical protein